MKILNKMDEIKIEDVSFAVKLSCVYTIRNLQNGNVYMGKDTV